jgi:hypothetical protein
MTDFQFSQIRTQSRLLLKPHQTSWTSQLLNPRPKFIFVIWSLDLKHIINFFGINWKEQEVEKYGASLLACQCTAVIEEK